LAACDVRDATCDLLSSTTLVVIFKKTEAEITALREQHGDAYKQPQWLLGMGTVISKMAANCVLGIVQPTVGMTTRARQSSVNAKGGCDMFQWLLQVISEAELDLDRSYLDAANAFGDMERTCIRAA
jgi:hypothetical protein